MNLVICMLIVICIWMIIFFFCRLEYKYMKLVEGSGFNYDGEFSGVDFCGLEDGEDE